MITGQPLEDAGKDGKSTTAVTVVTVIGQPTVSPSVVGHPVEISVLPAAVAVPVAVGTGLAAPAAGAG